jgi:serine/threonine protein kinase
MIFGVLRMSNKINIFLWLSVVSLFLCCSSQAAERKEIDKNQLERKEKIGSGAFSDIYTGILKKDGQQIPVAIKAFHMKSLVPQCSGEFDPYYATVGSPYLMAFYGVYDSFQNCALVFEFLPYSLAKFYALYDLSWDNIYNFGEQLAQGLAYLHAKGFGHKHLKSNNIFVTDDLKIKIADFGLSGLKLQSASNGHQKTEMSVRWRAPETFTREYAKMRDSLEAQKPADMFSYGLILWEMKVRHHPFQNYDSKKVIDLLLLGTREEIDKSWPKEFQTLLHNLWSFVPSTRQTAEEVIRSFAHPSFNLEEARRAPVAGYMQQNGNVAFKYNNFGQSKLIYMSEYLINKCKVLKEALRNKCLVFPTTISEQNFTIFAAVAMKNPQEWKEEFEDLYHKSEDNFAIVLNTAEALGYHELAAAGAMFVAEKLKEELLKPFTPPPRTRLLLDPEEERSQNEFEQLILQAIRQQKVSK